MTAEQLLAEALRDGDAHSAVFQLGMLATFQWKLGGQKPACHWAAGSVESDAFYYGAQRAAAEWRGMQRQEQHQ